jgi:hypothetical protein
MRYLVAIAALCLLAAVTFAPAAEVVPAKPVDLTAPVAVTKGLVVDLLMINLSTNTSTVVYDSASDTITFTCSVKNQPRSTAKDAPLSFDAQGQARAVAEKAANRTIDAFQRHVSPNTKVVYVGF